MESQSAIPQAGSEIFIFPKILMPHLQVVEKHKKQKSAVVISITVFAIVCGVGPQGLIKSTGSDDTLVYEFYVLTLKTCCFIYKFVFT